MEQPIEPADVPPGSSTADPDECLVAKAQTGDPAAITELYRRHERRVFNLALRMTNDSWDAADLTQEVFIKVFANLAGFKGDARFTTWMHRVATNVVYDHLRRRRVDPVDDETLQRLATTPVGQAHRGAGPTWTSAAADPGAAATRPRPTRCPPTCVRRCSRCPRASAPRSSSATCSTSRTARPPRSSTSPRARSSRGCSAHGPLWRRRCASAGTSRPRRASEQVPPLSRLDDAQKV